MIHSTNKIKEHIKSLKNQSGTHSPSIDTLLAEIPDLKIAVDACFLSNPYATDLFLEYLDLDLLKTNKLRDVLEFYPPQNREVAKKISRVINVDYRNIFVGNGAIEIIQAVLHNFVSNKVILPIPTFSSYYEFVKEGAEVIFYRLNKESDFYLNPIEYVKFINQVNPDTIVLVNPNNPNGAYLKKEDIEYILENCKNLENIILDESFIHFAYEDKQLSHISSEKLISKYPNLIIIKSMSKDFGVAGLRAGYAVMDELKVNFLLKNGYLWNVSGLANYFFKVYSEEKFIQEYEIVRKKYIENTLKFISDLKNIPQVKIYSSKANFVLMELSDGRSSFDFTMDLLINHGIYVRDCSDKIGLEGQFVRIASRTFEENQKIVNSINQLLLLS
jgi:histidinol-phosphate/aromatic aminotransferase/cobyric acid decarboxylase-like protein